MGRRRKTTKQIFRRRLCEHLRKMGEYYCFRSTLEARAALEKAVSEFTTVGIAVKDASVELAKVSLDRRAYRVTVALKPQLVLTLDYLYLHDGTSLGAIGFPPRPGWPRWSAQAASAGLKYLEDCSLTTPSSEFWNWARDHLV